MFIHCLYVVQFSFICLFGLRCAIVPICYVYIFAFTFSVFILFLFSFVVPYCRINLFRWCFRTLVTWSVVHIHKWTIFFNFILFLSALDCDLFLIPRRTNKIETFSGSLVGQTSKLCFSENSIEYNVCLYVYDRKISIFICNTHYFLFWFERKKKTGQYSMANMIENVLPGQISTVAILRRNSLIFTRI